MKHFFRYFLLAAASVLTPATVSAQNVFDNPDNHAYFGIRASLDVTSPGDVKQDRLSIDMYNPSSGFSIGAVYNIPLYKNLYFEPGLKLFYNTTGINNELLDFEDFPQAKCNASLREFGFRIPFLFGYRFDFQHFSASVYTGPELGVGLSGTQHVSVKYGNVKESDSENMYKNDMYNRCDLAWTIGVGFSYSHYYLGLSGNLGMLNRYDNSDDSKVKWNNNLFQLTLGYNF